jgi:hypothetical protein
MTTPPDENKPTSTGTTPMQQSPADEEHLAAADGKSGHGSSGAGAESAMARLISQEKARAIPAAPEDPSSGS